MPSVFECCDENSLLCKYDPRSNFNFGNNDKKINKANLILAGNEANTNGYNKTCYANFKNMEEFTNTQREISNEDNSQYWLTPLICEIKNSIQNPKYHIQTWPRGGISSRLVVKDAYLNKK